MRLFVYILFLFGSILSAMAARTDTVYLYNGDRITGEIKYLRDNKLSFKTDRAGTIAIEWPSVSRIYSANYFDVVTSSNQRAFGRLLFAEKEGVVILELGSFSEEHNLYDIVSIDRIKSGFFEQLSGTISLSVNFTKANENLQINGGFDITHRSRKYQNGFKANTIVTNNQTSEQTQRSDASYSFQRVYNSPWFLASSLSYQSNTELNMKSRYQVFGGGGYYFLRKPGKDFFASTGLSYNMETSIEEPITETQNVEYVAGIRFHQFKFREPQIDILANVNTYTSLNVQGRFRFDAELTFLWELFADFKWNVTFYNNFDNKPPGGGESLNDWNVLTGLTYTL